MKVAVAGIPGAWSSEHLAASLRDLGAESFVLDLGDITHDLGSGQVNWRDLDLSMLDGVVIKKLGDQADAWGRLRLHPLRALEAAGVRIFSTTSATDCAMDRYHMSMVLARAGLPIPRTIAVESDVLGREAIDALGDAVLKPVYTSKGRGMRRVRAGRDPCVHMDGDRYLIQQFVEAPGRDIGATVVAGSFLGAFYRVARDGEWMTTTSKGGAYAPCRLSDVGVSYAERAAQAFGLDYTVVDLVEHEDDFLIYEVSAFGGFRGLREASDIDAAAVYARHVVETLRERS